MKHDELAHKVSSWIETKISNRVDEIVSSAEGELDRSLIPTQRDVDGRSTKYLHDDRVAILAQRYRAQRGELHDLRDVLDVWLPPEPADMSKRPLAERLDAFLRVLHAKVEQAPKSTTVEPVDGRRTRCEHLLRPGRRRRIGRGGGARLHFEVAWMIDHPCAV